MKLVRCHNCGVPEGQEHGAGCTVEVCPHCGAPAVGHHCQRAARLPRVPFLHFPSVCARCGAVDAPWFGVPDAVWTYYIPPFERAAILCKRCFETIVRLIDQHRTRPDWLPSKTEVAEYAAVWSRFNRSSLRGPERRRLAAELDALEARYSPRRSADKPHKSTARRRITTSRRAASRARSCRTACPDALGQRQVAGRPATSSLPAPRPESGSVHGSRGGRQR
jgi:hypothetical protein